MQKNSTKELVDIADIRDDVIVLKDGSLRSVVEVSAINFELRSNDEQTAIIQSFQSFLNAADFPVQICITSRRLDLSSYVETLDSAISGLSNELLKIQATEYAKFVTQLADLSNIMSKKFYVVVSFYAVSLPSGSGILESIKGIFGGGQKVQKINEESLTKYAPELRQRVDLVLNNLVGLGLKPSVVSGAVLENLFYQIYNPDSKTKFIKNNLEATAS